MPRCYMVKKSSSRHDISEPCSPTEASVATPSYNPYEDSTSTDHDAVEYADLESGPLAGRSAAEREAAHDLLSLANSLPPLPPTQVVSVIQAPEPVPIVPNYTYTLQPTNIFILSQEPPGALYQTLQAVPTIQSIGYTFEQPVNFVAYAPQTSVELAEGGYNITSVIKENPASHQSMSSVNKKQAKYNCSDCGKHYATSSNLSRHKQTHLSLDSGAAKQCAECGKVYVSMPALSMHVLTHGEGHVCNMCGKQFSRPWLLRGHLRSHTGEKPYPCTKCVKTFADRSNLRAHLQTHSTVKKYECLRCHKTFALKSYLNKHQESACVNIQEQ